MSWLRGTWEGQYTYDTSMEEVGGMSVPFRMTLWTGWFGRLKGEVRDDVSRGGQPELGRIGGMHRKPTVTFSKLMPEAYYTGARMERVADVWAREEPGVAVERTWSEILYQGRWDRGSDQLMGGWEYLATGFVIDGETRRAPSSGSFGTWSARRIRRAREEL